MSFHASAHDIHLDGPILKARLNNENGDAQDAELNLNDILGNENGRFAWGGNNFHETAEDVNLSFEGGENLPILRARLRNNDGETHDANVNLSERLGNSNGQFSFQ